MMSVSSSFDSAMRFFLIGMLFGTVINYLLKFIPGLYRPPYSVMLFLSGFACANVALEASSTEHLNWLADSKIGASLIEMIHVADDLHPHLILYVLLPPLLFHASFNMDWYIFKKIFWQAFLLAVPGVLISCFLTSMVPKFLFMHSSEHPWGWTESMLLGAILSATDPVAVVVALKAADAPEKLSAVIEGEALLNDGSAYVLFIIILGFVSESQAPISVTNVAIQVVRLAIGGPMLGFIFGILLTYFLMGIHHDVVTEVTLVVLSTFILFAIGSTINVSSVLAVVALGILFSAKGRWHLSADAIKAVQSIYATLNLWANTMLFLLSGIVAFKSLFISGLYTDRMIVINLFTMYILLHVIRGIVIFGMYKLGLRNMGYGLTGRDLIFMIFSGLRGAIALVLSLLVQLEPGVDNRTKHRIAFHTAGIVLLTLVINGTSASAVYQLLRTLDPNNFSDELFKKAMQYVEDRTRKYKTQLKIGTNHIRILEETCWDCMEELGKDLSEEEMKQGKLMNEHFSMKSVSTVIKSHPHLDQDDERRTLKANDCDDNIDNKLAPAHKCPHSDHHFGMISIAINNEKMMNTELGGKEKMLTLSRMVKAKYQLMFLEGRINQFVINHLIGATSQSEQLCIDGKKISKQQDEDEDFVLIVFRETLENLVNRLPDPYRCTLFCGSMKVSIFVEAMIMFSIVHRDILEQVGHRKELDEIMKIINKKLDNLKRKFPNQTMKACTLIQSRAVLYFQIARVRELQEEGYITEKVAETLEFSIKSRSSELDKSLFFPHSWALLQ